MARSFSGDKKQLVPLLEAAFSHRGLAFLDVISPCVTFNNHDESTKSYTYHRQHEVHFHDPTFVPYLEHIDVEYEEGEAKEVSLHDGSRIILRKLDRFYDPTDPVNAVDHLAEAHRKGEVLTGLLYIDTESLPLMDTLNLPEETLASLTEEQLRPSRESLEELNRRYRV